MEDLHFYEVNLFWNTATHGTLISPVIPSTAKEPTPLTFPKRRKEKWTPEHLFVGAVNSCLMSTFLLVAENSRLEFISLESNALAKIEMINGKLTVTEIVLRPTLVIPAKESQSKAKKVLEMSEKACAVSNSASAKITLDSIITRK
jgi:organic hydroperoxide reductase OsmC/OhrA